MCRLYEKMNVESTTAYKVALKKDKRYYSPATGIEYKKYNEQIPIPTEINPALDYYYNFLNKKHFAYNREMIGRTAAFIDKSKAFIEAKDIKYSLLNEEYSICILKVELSNDLMRGTYGIWNIVAGRKMRIIGEENMTDRDPES